MLKSYNERVAALEALEAAAARRPTERLHRMDDSDVALAAIEAVWDGTIQFHGRADARPTLRGCYPADMTQREYIPQLCTRINALLARDGERLVFWDRAMAAEWLNLFQCGAYVLAGTPTYNPDYAVVQRLRRPNGDVWNTQGGGDLVLMGRALVSWAAQCEMELTCAAAVLWLSEYRNGEY